MYGQGTGGRGSSNGVHYGTLFAAAGISERHAAFCIIAAIPSAESAIESSGAGHISVEETV